MNEVIRRIHEKYGQLTEAQRRVADIVLGDPACLALLTSSKLAQQAGVSEATTVRFAMELGYSGYAEIKRAMQDGMMENRTLIKLQESVKDSDSRNCYTAAMRMDMENITRTMRYLDMAALDLAVDRMCRARQIFVLGRCRSEALALYLESVLKMLLDRTVLLTASNTLESIADVGDEDCVFAISFKRYSKETVQIQRHCKGKGAFCIGLTDSSVSPLAEVSDLTFKVEVHSASLVDSYTAAISLINGILTRISQKNQEKSRKKLEVLEGLYKDVGIFY